MAILEVNGLTKIFGGLTAVNEVDFKVEKDQIVGLIGPNGAGKTTIFNLITGVYKVSSGSVKFMDKNIENLEPHLISQMGITRTFQNIRLFKKLTVYENIVTACHLSSKYNLAEAMLFGTLPAFIKKNLRSYKEEKMIREEAQELLEILNLTERQDLLANNLPYGLQRRLEIARALALKPKLLLLDEPAAGMNPDETLRLMELIGYVRQRFNLSVLIIEHHMDLIMGISDNIVVLNFGCKLTEGPPDKVQNDKKVKEAYLGEEEADMDA